MKEGQPGGQQNYLAGHRIIPLMPRGRPELRHDPSLLVGSVLALIAMLAFPVCVPSHAAVASVVVTVNVAEFLPTLFSPQGVNLSVGDTVCWVSLVGDHTATSFSGQAEYWNSGDINDGMSYCHSFTHSGNFTYHSTFPEDEGQIGWVYVQQPVPEFPGYIAGITVFLAAVMALSLEKRVKLES